MKTTEERAKECPRRAAHAEMPEDRSQRAERMDELSKTHNQHRCGGCGLWLIWAPKEWAA